MNDEERLARLEQRLDRERRARQEAERIAEAGMRELYEANRSLDARIAERTRELEQATHRAEAASDARGRFLAHISHEMRTPLNGIVGMLELLADEVHGGHAEEWLSSARASADRLDRLFARTLRVVELESDDLAARAGPVGVEGALTAAGDRWRAACTRAGQLLSIEIGTAGGAEVRASQELALAFDELLDNVVTHASAGSVTLSSTPVDGGVRFAVDDAGPGPARAAAGAAEVLDPGAAPSTRRSSGAGIGLALVGRIAEALGGRSGVDPNERGGTHAWFELPGAGEAAPNQAGSTLKR